MSKENFKIFAKKHPELADNVITGKVTWQKLYELYDIYGENSNIWDRFTKAQKEDIQLPIRDIFHTLKNLDMDTVQKGVINLQKTIGLIQDLGFSKNNNNYEPQPIYRRFED